MITPDLTGARWVKSSYTGNNGTCVEVATGNTWVKSSYSGNNGSCVEIAAGQEWMAVRDSKDPSGPALTFTPAAFTAFIDAVKSGEFDL